VIEQKQQKRNAVASKSVQSFNEFTRSKNSKSSVKVKSENRGFSKNFPKASPVSKSAIDLTIETSLTPKAGITDPIIWQKAVEERQKVMEEKMDTFMSTMAILVSKVTVAPAVTKVTSVYGPSASDASSGAVLGVPVERSSVSEPSVGAPIIAAAALKEVVSAPPLPSITAQSVLPTVDESDPLPDGILTSDVGGGKCHHDASVDESGSVASSSSKRKRGKIASKKDNVAGSSQSSQSTPVTRSKRKLNEEEGGKEASKK
jgi:hypothetical protein